GSPPEDSRGRHPRKQVHAERRGRRARARSRHTRSRIGRCHRTRAQGLAASASVPGDSAGRAVAHTGIVREARCALRPAGRRRAAPDRAAVWRPAWLRSLLSGVCCLPLRSPRGNRRLRVLLVASLVTAGPGAQDRGDPEPLPELARVARVFAEDGAELDLDRLLDALAAADVVFCGETHLDEVTHRVELFLYEGLLQRREGKVVLALEMFATDAQPVLDEYVQGRCDEASFLARSRPWSNYRTGYRPLVERARRDRLPVVAANAPAALTRRVASGGAAAFAALDEAERNLLPLRLLPTSEAYWKRVARATRGHVGAGGATDPERLLYSTQSLWDNTMG